MENKYVFVADENGERKATYLLGRNDDEDKELQRVQEEYPDCECFIGYDEPDYREFVAENKLRINGAYVERPPYVPTEAELLAAAKSEKLATLQRLLDATDYKAIKFAEGVLTAEDYAPTKAKRQAWRNAYNAIEAAETVNAVNSVEIVEE